VGGAVTGPFHRIRELMNTPFARPPGRRGLLRRFAPELLAVGTYCLFLALDWRSSYYRHGRPDILLNALGLADLDDLGEAAAWSYGLVAVLLMILPLASAASLWSGERSRRTLEGLTLTPVDRRGLAWGRFLLTVWPWTRYLLWMLPLYLLLAGNGIIRQVGRSSNEGLLIATVCIGGCKPLFVAILDEGKRRMAQPDSLCFLIVLLRWGQDLAAVVVTVALASYVSMRSRGPGAGLLLTWLIVPGVTISLFSLHDWLLLVLVLAERSRVVSVGGRAAGMICFTAWLVTMAIEVAMAWWCLRALASNFDRYALREGAPA